MQVNLIVILLSLLFFVKPVCNSSGKELAQKVLTAAFHKFTPVIDECGTEVPTDERTIFSFFRIYDPNYSFAGRHDMGCVIYCILLKLEIINGDGFLNIDNTVMFTRSLGADFFVMKHLIRTYRSCKANTTFDNFCEGSINMFNCYRDRLFVLGFTPEYEDLFKEEDEDIDDFNLKK